MADLLALDVDGIRYDDRCTRDTPMYYRLALAQGEYRYGSPHFH